MLLKAKINPFGVEIPAEIIIVIFGLSSSLFFFVGSFISPRTKNLKAEIKYLEGKYHRLRQDQKNDDSGGFDLGSLIGGGGVGDILKFVEKNPDIIQKLMAALTPKPKNPDYQLR